MEKPAPPSRTADQFVVRFPDGMRDRIAACAKAAGRSMNAEIVHRLQISLEEAQPPKPATRANEIATMGVQALNEAAARWTRIRALERKRTELLMAVAERRPQVSAAREAYKECDPLDDAKKQRLWLAIYDALNPIKDLERQLVAIDSELGDLYDAASTDAPGAGKVL